MKDVNWVLSDEFSIEPGHVLETQDPLDEETRQMIGSVHYPRYELILNCDERGWTSLEFVPENNEGCQLFVEKNEYPVMKHLWKKIEGDQRLSIISRMLEAIHLKQSQLRETLNAWTDIEQWILPATSPNSSSNLQPPSRSA